MLRHKRIDTICIVVCCLAVILTLLFMNGESWGLQTAADSARYSELLFDDTKVHSLDIVIDEAEWQALLENASEKEYATCTVVIDGESFAHVGLRAKGNTSLSNVSMMNSDRYSFKISTTITLPAATMGWINWP